MKLLIVDDDTDALPKLIEAWRLGGHNVTHAADLGTLQAVVSNEYDAIVLDMMLPPLDGIPISETGGGYTAGLYLYETIIMPAQRDTPVIIYTAADDSTPMIRDAVAAMGRHTGVYRGLYRKPADITGALERLVSGKGAS